MTLLPNTSGARNAQEAVRIARLARELGCGNFVKVEIMRDSKYLLPDNQETIKATELLAKEGFVVMPYMYPDLNVARDLVNAGAACVMPLASPIGSNKGLATKEFIQILIDEIDLPIIVDAGIGKPSQACEAMEMGAAAIMANTALATASGNRSRKKGIFIRFGTCAYKRSSCIRPTDRIFTLKALLEKRYYNGKPVFNRFRILIERSVREETPPGNRPLLKKESYGIYGRNGTDQIRCHG